MAYTKTLADADAYFSPLSHSRAADWRAFGEQVRQGALTQSQRELELYLNRSLEDPVFSGAGYSGLQLKSFARDDYACFEQALEILDRQPRKVTGSSQKKISKPEENEQLGFRISPQALQYLEIRRLKIVRG